MGKINVAELLKGCPSGMELDCTMYENLYFDSLNADYYGTINCYTLIDGIKTSINFTKYGTFNNHTGAKCVIFPKGKTTWEGFQIPFKDGDIITCTNSCSTFTSIFKKKNKRQKVFVRYCALILDDNNLKVDISWSDFSNPRFATEEEKEKLFQAIKDNGYKWNAETKTLEKLIEPKFKVGDRIRNKKDAPINISNVLITKVNEYSYEGVIGDTTNPAHINFKHQDLYELMPVEPTFKVGDKVRHKDDKTVITITGIKDDYYFIQYYNSNKNDYQNEKVSFKYQDKYELVPNKFDINTLVPFESRVLVRNDESQYWIPAFWGCYSKGYIRSFVVAGGNTFEQCIPYKGNEHLLETNNDCNEFYKIWKN